MPHKMMSRLDSTDTPRTTFWFDTETPRRDEGRKEAIERVAKIKDISPHALEKLKIQVHHVDLDRSNGHADNLFVCIPNYKERTADKQHNNLHNQLHAKNIFELKTGLVKFDREKKFYYLGPELEKLYREKAKELHVFEDPKTGLVPVKDHFPDTGKTIEKAA